MMTDEQRWCLYVGVSIPEGESGGWGAILIARQERQEFSGFEPATSTDRLGLLAIIAGLSALEPTTPVCVVTGNQRLHSGLSANLRTWQRNDWQGRNGQVIRHHELWRRVLELAEARDVASSLRPAPDDAILIARAKRLANRAAQLRARRVG